MTTDDAPVLNTIATGLRFPEGPIAMPDGSLLFTEQDAGDGRLVIGSAKSNPGVTGFGVDLNPKLVQEARARAWVEGVDKQVTFLQKNVFDADLSKVASVASFFISRIDSAVDKELDDKIAKANDPSEKARLEKLKGKIAIANAKLFHDTEQVRALNSKLLYSDALQGREQQLEIKNYLGEIEKKREQFYH